MLPVRCLLVFLCVYGATSQDSQCRITKKTMKDMVELRRRLAFLIDLMKDYKEQPTTTPVTTEAETVPTTTTEKVTEVKTVPTTEATTTTSKPTTERPTPEPVKYNDCQQIMDDGYDSGFYQVYVPGLPRPISVFCDMDIDGGGWMVFQRRVDGLVNFNRSYAEYARGFGEPYDEFWMGNDAISAFTQARPMELRIDLSDWEDKEVYAKYSRFVVEGGDKAYRLNLGKYVGTAGNSLGYHDGSLFSTYDVDNDQSSIHNCTRRHTGGWWFKSCMRSNLNGRYIRGGAHESYADGIAWSRFMGLKYSLMFSEMKMRPLVA